MRYSAKWISVLALALLTSGARAQDTNIQESTVNRNVDIDRNDAWANINRAFIFTPLNSDQSQCLFIHNQNPTNPHSLTVSIFQTGDSAVQGYTGNTDRWVGISPSGTVSPVASLSTNAIYWRSTGAARVAIVISGSTTAAGSPDNVDIFMVQTTTTSCGAVNQNTGQQQNLSTARTGTSSTLPIQVVSDGDGTAFLLNGGTLANPAAGNVLAALSAPASGTKNLYLDKIIITSTVALQVNLILYTSLGTGCAVTPSGGSNLKVGSSNTSVAQTLAGCTTTPLGGGPLTIFVSANAMQVVDLRGLIITPTANTGLSATVSLGGTGAATAVFVWYEK